MAGEMAAKGKRGLPTEASSHPRDTPRFLRTIRTTVEVCLGNHPLDHLSTMIGNAPMRSLMNLAALPRKAPSIETVTVMVVATVNGIHAIIIPIIKASVDSLISILGHA